MRPHLHRDPLLLTCRRGLLGKAGSFMSCKGIPHNRRASQQPIPRKGSRLSPEACRPSLPVCETCFTPACDLGFASDVCFDPWQSILTFNLVMVHLKRFLSSHRLGEPVNGMTASEIEDGRAAGMKCLKCDDSPVLLSLICSDSGTQQTSRVLCVPCLPQALAVGLKPWQKKGRSNRIKIGMQNQLQRKRIM